MHREFYTIKEVASMLGVSPNTIRWWVWINKIPHIKLGRRVLIPASWLEKLQEQALKQA